jgi:hypothetical protein
MAHTGVFHDQLEGLPPTLAFFPGYYCTTRMPSNAKPREILSKVYTPPMVALIS